jgi:hypothetical protein
MTAKEKLRERVEGLSEEEAARARIVVEERDDEAVGEAIAEGYRRLPQTGEEDAWAMANAREAIREEPW